MMSMIGSDPYNSIALSDPSELHNVPRPFQPNDTFLLSIVPTPQVVL